MNAVARAIALLTKFVFWTGFRSAIAQEAETARPNVSVLSTQGGSAATSSG